MKICIWNSDLMCEILILHHEFLITGDFNIHFDHPGNSQVKQFLAALDSTNLIKHVFFPTHRDHHILDLVITPTSSSLNPVIDHSPVSPSDHLPIFSSLSILPSILSPLTQISFRCFKSIGVSKFTRDILHSRLITHPPTNLSDLVDAYNSTLTSLSDIHAPLKTKTIRAKPINTCYTPAPYATQNSTSSPGKLLASRSLTSFPQTPSHCL